MLKKRKLLQSLYFSSKDKKKRVFKMSKSIGMASVSSFFSEEQFLCSICLDVLNHPVSTACGHNFCQSCITQHWEGKSQFQCPMCTEIFNTRPELRINCLLSETASQFRKSVTVKDCSCPDQQCAISADVSCDICIGLKHKAVKSCLVCVVSYCETHLEPHQRVPRLKTHQLIDPVENLEDKICNKHSRPLDMFCKTDEVCVCQFCSELDHQHHLVVPLKEEYEGKKAQLGQTEAEIQQMIRERQLKIQQIQRSVKLSKDDADRQIEDGVMAFRALIHCIEESQAEVISTIQDQQKSTERQAEGFIKELEQDIMDLTERSSELEKLSQVKDHLHLLQSLSFQITPHTKDWTKVKLHQPSYVETMTRALDQLEKTLNMEITKVCDEAELKRVRYYTVDLTLDSETAYPYMIVSEDGKEVYDTDVKKNLPDNPERFSLHTVVLTKQSFSSGRFYFEVEVKGKTEWTLGVARKSINRKEAIALWPVDGVWTVYLRNSEYIAGADPNVVLSVKEKLQKVGVFVDYEGGVVSFYDVENKVHIYSFTGFCFTEPLYPLLSPRPNDAGKNSTPLIITPVNKTVTTR